MNTLTKVTLSIILTATTALAGVIALPANAAVGTYTILIGDSLANYGKDELQGYRPTWEVDAINGSSPATLAGRIDAAVADHSGQHPRNIIVELGTNYSSSFTPSDYRIVRTKLPSSRIVFVTPGRDPFIVGAESARLAAAYAYYMIRLANVDDRMCIVPWAEAVAASPWLLRADGVHATPESEDRWAREVVQGVDACATTEP